jgi:hypothetical protein
VKKYIWVFELNIMLSSFIYFPVNNIIYFLMTNTLSSPSLYHLYLYHIYIHNIFFIQSSVVGYLSWFHSLGLCCEESYNKHGCAAISLLYSFRYTPKSGMTRVIRLPYVYFFEEGALHALFRKWNDWITHYINQIHSCEKIPG